MAPACTKMTTGNRYPLDVEHREFALLCACAKSHLVENDHRRITELVTKEIDWDKLLTIAVFHNSIALLHKSLNEVCLKDIPEPILHKLRTVFYHNGIRCFELTDNLLKILDIFADTSIPVVPIKGPLLAETLLGDLTLRSYGDLDLLIPSSRLGDAINLLVAQGFVYEIDLDQKQFINLAKSSHHAFLYHPMSKVAVELHWELTGKSFLQHIKFEDLAPHFRNTSLAGRSVHDLGVEDLLVFLCVHGHKHFWSRLDMVCCVAELIRREQDLDWESAMNIATRLGARKILFTGLLLAEKLLAVELPDRIIDLVKKDIRLNEMTLKIVANLCHARPAITAGGSYWQFVDFQLSLMDRFSDFFYCTVAKPIFGTTQADWLSLKLPASFAFLHHFYRPLRLLGVRIRNRVKGG